MSAAHDASEAVARLVHSEEGIVHTENCICMHRANRYMAQKMPDDRTIAVTINDGAELERRLAAAVALIDEGHVGPGAVHGCTICDVYVLLTEGTTVAG